ncbi:MAG: NAD(P)H-binding protein [Salinibacter sp.]
MSCPDCPTVAIAGATGFIGTAVRRALRGDAHVVGLTRSPVRARVNADRHEAETWRHCDLFDPHAVRAGLEGADVAIYLVHSMHPTSRLTQAQVADLDLLQADNFARAAAAEGVEQILYLGALVPTDETTLPPRLRSRQEIEQALGAAGVPVTTLRTGFIVGPGGTWLRLLLNLVHRLPVMLLPAWTEATTQPIALDDIVRGLLHCLGRPETYGRTYDVGGPERMTYRDLLTRTADVLGLRRPMATVPFDAPELSKLWVHVFGGVPWALVSPIVDSLRYQAEVQSNPLQEALVAEATSFSKALAASVDADGRPLPNPRDDLRDRDDAEIQAQSVARSVQRMPCPPSFDARDVALEYLRWLPRLGWPLLQVRVSQRRVARFQIRPTGHTLLTLQFADDRSPQGRQAFYVTGGLLVDDAAPRTGRLEFRQALDGRTVLAAVHDFSPRLPWPVYNGTQALVHLLVMHRFRRHLARLSDEQTGLQAPVTASTDPRTIE